MSAHPVAAGGFASASPTSTRLRPTYARHAIGRIKETVGAGAVVLDLRAGTGILAGQLVRAGMQVIAAEPDAEMTDQLRRALPSVPALRALPRRLPFADSSFAAVVVAEPSDRCGVAEPGVPGSPVEDAADAAAGAAETDTEDVVAELVRVVRPGGVLATLSNRLDASVEWVQRYEEILLAGRPAERPEERGALTALTALVEADGRFIALARETFPNPRPCTPEQLVERATSAPTTAADGPTREQVAQVAMRVRALIAEHPELSGRPRFELPCCTELHVWRSPP